ncbi:MAG TPA: hypothetical protein DCS93_02720 [Microscillaceae bacterium]|nr:hypothetical protein [Microscillaceae bacterium]
MTFFNNYKKTENSRYYDATQIGNEIYSIGRIFDGSKYAGLVTKVDLSGRVIWEKSYTVNGQSQGFRFEKVVACVNGDILVAGILDQSPTHLILTRIASDGSVVWQKYYAGFNVQEGHLVGLPRDAFYVVIGSVPFTNKGVTAQHLQIIAISGDGSIISQTASNIGRLAGATATPDGNQLLLYGQTDGGLAACHIYDFNQAFSVNNQFTISIPRSIGQLFQVAYHGKTGLLIRGNVRSTTTTEAYDFITKAPIPGNPASGTFPVKLLPSSEGERFALANDGSIYFTQTISGNPGQIVSRYDANFTSLQSKLLDIPTPLTIGYVGSQQIVLHGKDSTLLSLGLELESCKTTPVVIDPPNDASLSFGKMDFSPSVAIQFSVGSSSANAQNVTSRIEEICPPTGGGGGGDDGGVEINELTTFQSPYLHLLAAGSTGEDSTQGIHLRWMFRGILGDTHLPKGDAANTDHNFNKSNDVVSLYRAPYQKVVTTLSFMEVPAEIDDVNATWIYRFAGDRELQVYFRNTSKYNELRPNNTLASGQHTIKFITDYGSNIIEIENKKEQFFAVEFTIDEDEDVARLLTETLSVEDNELLTIKAVSARNAFTLGIDTELRLVCENGRCVRLQPEGSILEAVHFEFYNDFISNSIGTDSWQKIGDYSLTLDNNIAFERLEPPQSNLASTVHGIWKRYNDDAYVNIDNYKKKWERDTEAWDRDIKQVVDRYIDLSNNADNPTATEQVNLDDGGSLDVSNLDLLNLAAYDYHVARMLGLGCLDIDSSIMTGTYVYIISYTTLGNLEDGQGAREVQHLTMSLPTTINDQRLPLPVKLKEVVPGAFFGSEANGQKLTNDEGYAQNGESRYVSLYIEESPEDQIETPFYQSGDEFSAADYTYPIYAGLEYGTTNGEWVKPELAHDATYTYEDANGKYIFETRPLQLPDEDQALFVHQQRVNGTHYYRAYGINLFSRATLSEQSKSIVTTLQPNISLLPPSDVNALLIRTESPLLLTSESEQTLLEAIPDQDQNGNDNDKTLIRLTFDYHTYQDMIVRTVPSNSPLSDSQLLESNAIYPDSQEVFTDQAEILFRNQMPRQVSGKVISVEDHPSNELLSIVRVDDYYMASVNKTLSPEITPGTEANYIGGTFALDKQQHLIQDVSLEAGKPVFTLYKKEIGDALINNLPTANADQLQAIQITRDGLFMAIENMQNISSWGNHNPIMPNIKIGDNWPIHREVIEVQDDDGNSNRQIEKTRGIWNQNANIDKELEQVAQTDADGNPKLDSNGQVMTTTQHRGLYKITLVGQQLVKHTQPNVEWFRGVIRVFTQGSVGTGLPQKTRKVLKVLRIENIDEPNDVVIYAQDSNFSPNLDYDPIQTGSGISVNFYPGYKAYLYANPAHHLDESHILPSSGERTRYSIFGLRSIHTGPPQHTSKISVPSPMFAQEIIEAKTPEQPLGALYATRPDFFGRSTYTFTTQYQHKPHGVLFYRASDEVILHTIYKPSTVQQIREALKSLGGNEEAWVTDRWQNFLSFNYNYPVDDTLNENGKFAIYPPEAEGYRFPNPDREALFEWINEIREKSGEVRIDESEWGNIPAGDDRLLKFVKGAIYNVFAPLTQVPIIYQHINGGNYEPVNKKQTIRDKNGYVLAPTHPDFDMAPMMKIVGTAPHKTQFTDFTLDGTSDNLYFYGVKELDTQMKMGDFSPLLGPIKLVNTNPPEAPEVKRIVPKLENVILNTPPAVQVEVNAYPAVQNIRKLNIYRAFSKLEAQSVRTMQLVDTVDLEQNSLLNESIWKIEDTFADLAEVPYGDGLFYRVTAARKVKYANKGNASDIAVEYAPSQASKIMATLMVEVTNPPAPTLSYTADAINTLGKLPQVVLNWEKTCYKGKYHVYKMNAKGNWEKIYEFVNEHNQPNIQVALQNTTLDTGDRLSVRDEDNNLIYHHFKVVTENTSGLLSTQEKILTIYSEQEVPSYNLSFNGNDAYLGSQPGFTQWGKSQAFTMQFFVEDLAYTTGSGVVHNPLFCSLPNGSGGGMIFGFRNDAFIISIQGTSSTYNSRLFSRGIPFSEITHIAVTYDGSGLSDGFMLYLNGVAQSVIQTNNRLGALEVPQTTSFTLCRGYSWTGGTNYTQTKVKNVSIVNYPKTESEILTDFNTGTQSVGTGAYLLAYDFNIDVGVQSAIIPGLHGSPDLDLFGATFLLT